MIRTLSDAREWKLSVLFRKGKILTEFMPDPFTTEVAAARDPTVLIAIRFRTKIEKGRCSRRRTE